MRRFVLPVTLLAALAGGCVSQNAQKAYEADVIVYGGTSAGVVAAVQAVKMGKSVILVSPDTHLGGLSAGGLGYTDSGRTDSIGGLSREFYQRVYAAYSDPAAWPWQKEEEFLKVGGQGTKARNEADKAQWTFEPRIAERVFDSWVKEHNITVLRDTWLDRAKGGVTKANGRITRIATLDGSTFKGKMFIDATYEGDLMAAAGVTYTVGRESSAMYGEEHNGVQIEKTIHHQFKAAVSAYKVPGDPASGVLPNVSAAPPGKTGEADRRVQAYCFRLCMTKHPPNRIPFAKPDGYDPLNYELFVREMVQSERKDFFNKFDKIPNLKTDTNNHGAFSFDYLGANYDYPEATYARRREIIKAHEDYQKGFLYFASTDPRVPAYIRDELATWGLAKDEFADNGGWPHQIYVREARRMIGPHVMTENDLHGAREVPLPVGMGSYQLDSHNVQRYITPEGNARNEGDIQIGAKKGPYRISYNSLTPKKAECENLLVPVCVSSSHMAYGSIRMEPVFMLLAQSATTAAVLAIDDGCAVQDLDYAKLAARLKADGQRF
ncbi:MAG: FAD-dependent oxidoreductase [Kiritimatiellaeota bacterium]|nr:FAD-dependent oxidoreductase [Kiritimatiellota bacterium]